MVPSRLFATIFRSLFLVERRKHTQAHKTCWHVDGCSITFFVGTRKSLINLHLAHIGSRTVAQKISKCVQFAGMKKRRRHHHQQQQQQPHQKYKQINADVCVFVCWVLRTNGWLSNHPTKTNRVHKNREPKEEK